ncbi:hypothetical protein UAY_01015 [Enterococcus moraviensis ATCC BAA-383]|uniref:Gram-positive cocci surface proteins LPxTG domain-containing protein n=1 Tax=Enterococcus moraviensis ATCC BAA-383 TaxID=1158609 RepID=R2T977_9ENTE|nr:hypothetical protein [Enterococcus moraviensis]EOI01609.1 hypothetical protein UAY_01015 [Enterococcus moraviensis ATCC BAA-383]EOT73856.1 hypothetical protein I586_00852 [Enterococcus moraviensis ATCC BAA-383]OJG64751.1 hypothetical protein RV09_GL001413 [Enterococcus moraviensis]
MKKVIGFIIAVVATVGFATSVSADGAISTTEQSIVNELNAGATIGGKKFNFGAAETNAVSNHLKRVDLTQAQADEAIKNIQSARALVEGVSVNASGANSLGDALRLLPANVISQLQSYVVAAGNAVGVKITFGAGGTYSAVTITDNTGAPVYQTGNPVKNTGSNYALSGITFGSLIVAAAGAVFVSRKNKLA